MEKAHRWIATDCPVLRNSTPMYPSKVFALIASLATIAVSSPLAETVQKRAQCAATLNTATSIANTLQSTYWNSGTGYYNQGELWTDANTYENLINLMLAAGTTTWANDILNSATMKAGANPNTNWDSYLGGSNDDSQWVILAFYKMADYLNAHGQGSLANQYMSSAQTIYNMIVGQWDGTCGGGVWWSTAHTYKNAITNQLFLLCSASGYLRTKESAYLSNAQLVWNWLSNSGMRNSQGLWNDGLDSSTCKNNGQTTWTYNQGVIASGLAALYAATGNITLLDQAEITLDATIQHLSTNNILKESCDDAVSGGAQCNHDQQSFKGIWTKHLQFYLDNANSASRTAKYSGFLGSQSSAVIHYATGAQNIAGSVWYAPSQGGSVFTPETDSSGLAAHVAAAKYGPC